MVVAIIVSMVAFLDSNVANLALPATERDLGGGLPLQQWVVDGYLLALAALILPGGSISDLFGRVPVLRFGLAAFGTGSLLAAAAAWPSMLIAARLIQGLGGALLVPGSLALINSAFDRADRPAAIGSWTAWTSTAFALGPLLGGLTVDALGWRWIYIWLAIPVIVGFALTFWLHPTPAPAERARVDVAGAVLSATGLGATVYALIEAQQRGWTSPMVALSSVVGVVALVAFVAWERRAPHPMVPLQLLTTRNFAAANLATAFVYGGLTLGSLATALYLQEVAGYPAIVAGLSTLPSPIVSFLFARRVGNAAARIGPRVFLVAGPVLAGVGLLLIRPYANDLGFATSLLSGRLVLAAGLALIITPLTSALTAVACLGLVAAGPLNDASFARLLEVAAALFFLGAVVSGVAIANQVAGAPTADRCDADDPSRHVVTADPVVTVTAEQCVPCFQARQHGGLDAPRVHA